MRAALLSSDSHRTLLIFDWSRTPYNLLGWAQVLGQLDSPPLVNSISYGNDEAQQTGSAYMESCNTQFKALGLRGVSILFASGDQGVCGTAGS